MLNEAYQNPSVPIQVPQRLQPFLRGSEDPNNIALALEFAMNTALKQRGEIVLTQAQQIIVNQIKQFFGSSPSQNDYEQQPQEQAESPNPEVQPTA